MAGFHSVASYLHEAPHPISIDLVGCGGNGSLMLTHLCRMHTSLLAMGRFGLKIICFDPDEVTRANVGRQAFSPADIGQKKAHVLASRANMFYGINVKSTDILYNNACDANIVITCTDNILSRWRVHTAKKRIIRNPDMQTPFYWLDIGNGKTTGQVVLGTMNPISQKTKKKGYTNHLLDVVDLFGDDYADSQDGPSCSLAEALEKQDLMINPIITNFGAKLLWDLLTKKVLDYHGIFINLDTLEIGKLPINGIFNNR